jgi:release factor glutamine methyltransferase
VNNLLENGIAKLKEHNIDVNFAKYLYDYLDDLNLYNDAIEDLIKGRPVQYIVGNVDFYGLNFKVNESVLIPRFETEELVEKTIGYIKRVFNHKVDIVDIGTGSGCIAISLKKNIECTMDAVDISTDALNVARYNANKLEADINFYDGNLLNPLTKKYDVIISNPPYIGKDEEIMGIVRNNEPHLALYADNGGLKCYEEILSNSPKYLNSKSIIAFEIGENQAKPIKEIALKYFFDADVFIEKDLQKRDRFIFIINGK